MLDMLNEHEAVASVYRREDVVLPLYPAATPLIDVRIRRRRHLLCHLSAQYVILSVLLSLKKR